MTEKKECCSTEKSSCTALADSALDYFQSSTQNCFEYARKQKEAGKKIVGIYCEFTPREVILAAGAVPICLCGGSHKMAVAGERDLPANLCPLIKSSYGFIAEEACVFFDMADAVIAETTCDGKKKMYEIVAERKPVYILELPYKIELKEAFDYWRMEVGNLKAFLEQKFDVEITDERLKEAIDVMNDEWAMMRKVHEFTASTPPYLKASEAIITRTRISNMPGDREMFSRLIDELEQRRSESAPAYCPDAPRILMTGVPMPLGSEKVLDIIEECGGAVVCLENCTGVKPLYENVSLDGDPLTAIAEKYFHLPCSCMTPNRERFRFVKELIDQYKVDAVVDLIWQGCHTYNIESRNMRSLVTDELGLPYIKIETDYSPSDEGQITLRLESFLELIKNRISQT
jgi:benzoyl-CoA reductase/2-hydroxyglutaryl-CoA dehydratase subunit BcrC/BadD/HgdB